MAIRTTRRADQDIIDIYLHGAENFGPSEAEKYHRGLLETFQFLAENPRAARERSDTSPPVRLYPYRGHSVIYLVEGADILIVRVLHGHQDWVGQL